MNFFKHPYLKYILYALAVAAGGFVLLNFAFVLDFLVFRVIEFFMPRNPESAGPQNLPIAGHVIFLIIIGLISWAVFRTKLPALIKAIYLTVPTAAVLVTTGILLHPSPTLPYLIGGLLTLGVLICFYITRKQWLYYYSVILVAVVLTIFTLMGGEI